MPTKDETPEESQTERWEAYFTHDGVSEVCEVSQVGDGAVCEVYESPTWKRDAALIAKAPEMLALLEELEWAGCDNAANPGCPVCGTAAPGESTAGGYEGEIAGIHRPDCRLGSLLSELRQPKEPR